MGRLGQRRNATHAAPAALPEADRQLSDEPALMVKASLYLGTPVESTRANPTEVPAVMLTFQVIGEDCYKTDATRGSDMG